MYWDRFKSSEFSMAEVLLSDVGNKALGRVSIGDRDKSWDAKYTDDLGNWHNLGLYLDFRMAKQIVEDRVNARNEQITP